jgi:very-short-patch-repair endonuclease
VSAALAPRSVHDSARVDDADTQHDGATHAPPVPPAPAVPPSLRTRVFRGSAAVRDGLLTPAQLRSSAWRRLFPGVYLHRDVPVTHALRAHAAARIVVPGAVVTGRSAATLRGVPLAGPGDEVELTVPPGRHPVRVTGLRVHRTRLPGDQVDLRSGVRLTSPDATAVELAGRLLLEDAVVAVDQLASGGPAALPLVREFADRATGPGSRRARRACALADGLAESPQETRLRLLIRRSGLPAPVAQHRVLDRGRFVARVDLGWPDQRVALEHDGLWHAEPGQFARDRERLDRLTAAGWRVVHVTAADLHRPGRLVARVAAALAA